jgi:cytochrome b561
MTTLDTTARPLAWDPVTKALHWSMALLIPLAWVLAIVIDTFPRESRGPVVYAHKTAGMLILALIVVRILWRFTHTAPDTEKTPWEPLAGLLAKAGHGLLYLLMIAVPLGGIATSFARGKSVPVFGLFDIPAPWVDRQPFAGTITEMHETAAHLLLILAFAHAVAGILHHVVLKDRTLIKMKPFAKG